jgi:hypothetical protein
MGAGAVTLSLVSASARNPTASSFVCPVIVGRDGELFELKQAWQQAAGDVEIVAPKFHGEESAARKTQPSARDAWDKESYLSALAQRCPEGVPLVRRLYEHAVPRRGDFSYGTSVVS